MDLQQCESKLKRCREKNLKLRKDRQDNRRYVSINYNAVGRRHLAQMKALEKKLTEQAAELVRAVKRDGGSWDLKEEAKKLKIAVAAELSASAKALEEELDVQEKRWAK